MPEGVAVAGEAVRAGIHDDPDREPAPDATAPRGWTWNRKQRAWAPRQRGPVRWHPESGAGMVPGEIPGHGGRGAAGHETPAPDAQRDPQPGWQRDDTKGGQGGSGKRQTIGDVPEEVIGDIAGLAGLVATPVLSLLQAADPYCGTILAQNFQPVLDATLPIICRSERIVRYFTDDKSDWLLWGKLMMVLAPVARAIAAHHVLGTVRVVKDEKTGQVLILEGRDAIDKYEQGDHLTPPARAEYNYAA